MLRRNPTPQEVARAKLRVAAAAIRDAGGPHAEDAAILCKLLDLHEHLSWRARRPESALNLADGLVNAIAAVRQRVGL
jgi:hypothetical protein